MSEPEQPPGGRPAGRAVAVLAALLFIGGCGHSAGTATADSAGTPAPVPASPVASPPKAAPVISRGVGRLSAHAPSPTPVAVPHSGRGTWTYASTRSVILGRSGTVHRFRVAVETGIAGVDANAFGGTVAQVLGDPRSWIGSGALRLQQVPGSAVAEFTVYLATRDTSTRMCATGGLKTGGFTSCRVPGKVIINLDRWDLSAAGIPLATYREYVINHETGHQLGHGHELCPAAGRPAPVMEQQTLGLHGCTANPWPYLNGARYAGPPGEY